MTGLDCRKRAGRPWRRPMEPALRTPEPVFGERPESLLLTMKSRKPPTSGFASARPETGSAGDRSLGARHECGLFAAVTLQGPRDVLPTVLQAMRGLQHRGQDSAGVAWRGTDGRLGRIANLGLVSDLPTLLPHTRRLSAAIGHVRYATFGRRDHRGAQPVLIDENESAADVGPSLALAFAGHIADMGGACRSRESVSGWESDAMMLADRLRGAALRMGLEAGIGEMLDDVDGALNMVVMTAAGEFFAVRDRFGFRPLHWATAGDVLLISSEDHVLRALGCESRELRPGELVSTCNGSVVVHATGSRRPAACSFEYVYFSHAAASFEHRSVHGVRERLGFFLAAEERSAVDNAVVVPVPTTGVVAARAFAERLGWPVTEGVIANSYGGRTFIADREAERPMEKHNIVPDCALGKDAFLVDDSLVRGQTLQRLVASFRRIARPRTLHVRLAAPPVLHPCFYGIDIPNRAELVAARTLLHDGTKTHVDLTTLARLLEVDSVGFLSNQAFRQAFAPEDERLCRACFTGDYPTPAGSRLAGNLASSPVRFLSLSAAGV